MPSRTVWNSARSNRKITSTPTALAISSTIGAAIGAASSIAASGPSASRTRGCCTTHVSASCKNALLNGKASAVAIHPPQRKAAANSHGVWRSRRSSSHRRLSGNRESRPESTSARKNTLTTSARMLASRRSWTAVAKASTAISAAQIAMQISRRRSAGPMRRRPSYTSATTAALPRRRQPGFACATARTHAWSQPTAHAGLIAEIDVAELALEIGFLAGDHTVTDDEIEQHQRREDPQTVEGDREADQAKDHAEINRVAGEAVGSVRDDRRCRFVGLDLRACLADRYDRPNRERQGDRENSPADPGAWNRCWNKSQGIEPGSCDARDKREYQCDGRANHCVGSVRVLAHLVGSRLTALPALGRLLILRDGRHSALKTRVNAL